MTSVPEAVVADDRPTLTNSPIVLVVAQIRFDRQQIDPKSVLRFHEAVGKSDYPQIAQAATPTVSVRIGETAAAPAAISAPWQFLSSDGSWTISVGEDAASLQTANGFTTWRKSFRPRLETFLKALSACMAPAITQRFGLRYINELTELSVVQSGELSKYLSKELVPSLDPRIPQEVVAAQQLLQLRAANGNMCGLRVAFSPQIGKANLYGCVLDFDTYSDSAVPFDYQAVLSLADTLNDQAHELFEASLNPAYLAGLR